MFLPQLSYDSLPRVSVSPSSPLRTPLCRLCPSRNMQLMLRSYVSPPKYEPSPSEPQSSGQCTQAFMPRQPVGPSNPQGLSSSSFAPSFSENFPTAFNGNGLAIPLVANVLNPNRSCRITALTSTKHNFCLAIRMMLQAALCIYIGLARARVESKPKSLQNTSKLSNS